MNCPTVKQIEFLHNLIIKETGGSAGLRERGALVSAVAQPQMSFGGNDLYATLAEKAPAMSYSLVSNRAFVDGTSVLVLLLQSRFCALMAKISQLMSTKLRKLFFALPLVNSLARNGRRGCKTT